MANVCGLALDPKAAVTQLIEICKASLCHVLRPLFMDTSFGCVQIRLLLQLQSHVKRIVVQLTFAKKRSRCSFKKT